MATKPKFSPDQDMENVTPQDLKDAKTRTKERKAYKDASKIGDDEDENYGHEGRGQEAGIGKRVISTGLKGAGKAFEKIFEANEYLDKKYGENVPENASTKAGRRALFGEKPETQTQAAKYVTNTLGKYSYAKGGMTASSRADGCAQRGKTRGTIIR
jgi:hypothetical protein